MVSGRRVSPSQYFIWPNISNLILICSGDPIRVHHAGVGRGAVGDHFIGRAAVGCPAGGGRVGVDGAWRRFTRRRIGGTRLIIRGMVSATGKKH